MAGQTIVLSMDQTDLGDHSAISMVSVREGDRALPLLWSVEAGTANRGFGTQRALLAIIAGCLPGQAAVLSRAVVSASKRSNCDSDNRDGW